MSTAHPEMAEGLQIEASPAGARIRDAAGRTHYLNATAAAVLALCDGARNAQAIARDIAEIFDLETAPCTDVDRALGQLAELGLLRGAGG